MSWSTALSVGGDLLGGILGSKKSSLGRTQLAFQNAYRQIDRNAFVKDRGHAERWEKKRVRRIARDAKKAGLHPLAVMGNNSSYSSPIQVGAGFNPVTDGANTGSAIGDAIASGAATIANKVDGKANAMAKAEAENMKKEGQLLDAQILESRSRTLLNQTNARRSLVGPQSPVDPFAIRQENALMEVKLENGDKVLIPNPDVYEVGPSELVTGRALLEGGRVVAAAGNPTPIKTTKLPNRASTKPSKEWRKPPKGRVR